MLQYMEAKTINVFESSVPMLDRNIPNAIEPRESRQRYFQISQLM